MRLDIYAAIDGAKDLLPERIRRSKRLRALKNSLTLSGDKPLRHRTSKDDVIARYNPRHTDYFIGDVYVGGKKVIDTSSKDYVGTPRNSKTDDWMDQPSSWHDAIMAANAHATPIFHQEARAYREELRRCYPLSETLRQDDIAVLAEDNTETSRNLVSQTETVIYNPSNEYDWDSGINDDIYNQGNVDVFLQKNATNSSDENINTSRNSVSDTETIIYKPSNQSNGESLESVISNNDTHKQANATIFTKDNIATIKHSVSETDTVIYKPSSLSDEQTLESATSEKNAYIQGKVDILNKNDLTTFENPVSEAETVVITPSKKEFLGSVISKNFKHHKEWQGKTWTPSRNSFSIYSQEGLVEPVLTLKTKQIVDLKAKLHNKQLEVDELRREVEAQNLKASELLNEKTKSASETGTIIHTPLNKKSSESFKSEYPIDEQKVAKISRRERAHNKIRRYLSSTQELIAPFKAIHPNNRPEKGHTKSAKQQQKEALEALENASIVFQSLPFESIGGAESPTINEPKPAEEHALPTTERSVGVISTSEDYIGFIKEQSDNLFSGAESLKNNSLKVTKLRQVSGHKELENTSHKFAKLRKVSDPKKLEDTSYKFAKLRKLSGPKKLEDTSCIFTKPRKVSGPKESEYTSFKFTKLRKFSEPKGLEVNSPEVTKLNEDSEPKKLADDYLGVQGFNPRTGDLDSSEEHIISPRRRVHWQSTEKGWESTDCPIIIEAFSAPTSPAFGEMTEVHKPVTYKPVSTTINANPLAGFKSKKTNLFRPGSLNVYPTEPVVFEAITIKPATRKPSIGKQVTTEQITRKPSGTKPDTRKPSIGKQVTTERTTRKPSGTKPVTIKAVASDPVTIKPSTYVPTSSKPAVVTVTETSSKKGSGDFLGDHHQSKYFTSTNTPTTTTGEETTIWGRMARGAQFYLNH